MNRRSILKFMGGGLLGGGKAAETLADTYIKGVNTRMPYAEDIGPVGAVDKGWARKELMKFMDPGYLEREKQNFYVDGLSPGVHSMKSISLVHKMRMSRDEQFKAFKRKRKGFLRRIISGEIE